MICGETSKRAALVAVTVAILTQTQSGYHRSMLNVPFDETRQFLDALNQNHSLPIGPSHLLWLTGATWHLGALLGAICSSCLMNRTGRTFWFLLASGGCQLAGGLLQFFGARDRCLPLLLAGRILTGFGAGQVRPALRSYLCECFPDARRATVHAATTGCAWLGSLLAVQLTGQWTREDFAARLPWTMAACAPLALVQMVVYLVTPRSPRFCLALRRNGDRCARRNLRILTGRGGDKAGLEELLRRMRVERDQFGRSSRWWRDTVAHRLRLSTAVGAAVAGVGVEILLAHSQQILIGSGLSDSEAVFGMSAALASATVGSLLAAVLVDRCRRRLLLLTTLLVCFFCQTTLILLGIQAHVPAWRFDNQHFALLFVLCVLMFFAALGPYAVLEWTLVELAPFKLRPATCLVGDSTSSTINLLCVAVYMAVFEYFCTFAAMSHIIPLALGTLCLAARLPDIGVGMSSLALFDIPVNEHVVEQKWLSVKPKKSSCPQRKQAKSH